MRYRLRKLLIPNGPPIGLTALALVAVLVLIAILAWRFFLYAMIFESFTHDPNIYVPPP